MVISSTTPLYCQRGSRLCRSEGAAPDRTRSLVIAFWLRRRAGGRPQATGDGVGMEVSIVDVCGCVWVRLCETPAEYTYF